MAIKDPRLDARDEPTHQDHRDHGAEAARRHDEPRGHDGIIHEHLEDRRNQDQGREQDDSDDEMKTLPVMKLRSLNKAGGGKDAPPSPCAR